MCQMVPKNWHHFSHFTTTKKRPLGECNSIDKGGDMVADIFLKRSKVYVWQSFNSLHIFRLPQMNVLLSLGDIAMAH